MAINPADRGLSDIFLEINRDDATFRRSSYTWQTGERQRRSEATVKQHPDWIFHRPTRGRLGHERLGNERAGIYTTGFRFCSRWNRAQLPDHLSISSENAPVRLGEPVQHALAAAPNRSEVKA